MSRERYKHRWQNSQDASACRKREFGPGPVSCGTRKCTEAWHRRYNDAGLREEPGDFTCAGDHQTAARPDSRTPSIHVCLHPFKLASGGYASLLSLRNLDHQVNNVHRCYFGWMLKRAGTAVCQWLQVIWYKRNSQEALTYIKVDSVVTESTQAENGNPYGIIIGPMWLQSWKVGHIYTRRPLEVTVGM